MIDMSKQHRNLLLTLLVLFGFQAQNLSAWAEEKPPVPAAEEKAKTDQSPEPSADEPGDGWVEVEPTGLVPADLAGNFYLVPYRARRTTWGYTFSVGYSTFKPDSYQPDFIEANYGDVYQSAETPLLEFQFSLKYNLAFGAFFSEAGVGTFQEESDTDLIDSHLNLIPVRVGLGYIMDTLFLEPYVSPYVSVGGYIVSYSEKGDERSFNGSTQVAPYVTAGLQLQLDWLDPAAARESYMDAGIEGTYVYVEGRKFFKSQAVADPDFETDFHLDTGLRVEF
jgi:hypothetical protein